MTDMIVFDFVAGAVLIQDRSGQERTAPPVLNLVATGPNEADATE